MACQRIDEAGRPPIFLHDVPSDAAVLPEATEPSVEPATLTYAEKWGVPAEDKELFRPDRVWATASSCDSMIFVWPVEHESSSPPCVRVLHPHKDVVTDYVMDWENMVSISCGLDCMISVTSVELEKKIASIRNDSGFQINQAFLSIDGDASAGKVVVGDGSGALKVADLDAGKILFKMKGHSQSVYGVRADWDRNQVVSCSWDRTVNIYDVRAGKKTRTLAGDGHLRNCNRIDVDFDMQLAVTCAWEHQFILWDLNSGRMIQSYQSSHRANDICVDWSKMVAATGGEEDGDVKIWNLESGECTKTIYTQQRSIQGLDVDWAQGRLLTATVDKNVTLFDIPTGKCLKQYHKQRRCLTQCWIQKARSV
mmetsp:Transcript_107981/g.262287  ORF Transcript_107981/g.262287 Transcript_107981/m.262287 type:complete len:367 (-) Transcript_107981:185-1285(-)